MTDPTEDRPTVGVSFRIPKELHREMKIWCLDHEATMKDLLVEGFLALKAADEEGQLKLFSRLPAKVAKSERG